MKNLEGQASAMQPVFVQDLLGGTLAVQDPFYEYFYQLMRQQFLARIDKGI